MCHRSEISRNGERNKVASWSRYCFIVLICLFLNSGCTALHRYEAPRIERYLTPPPRKSGIVHTPDRTGDSEHRAPLTLAACVRIALAKNLMQQAAQEGVSIARAKCWCE